jgi:signal transduction histidine kinase
VDAGSPTVTVEDEGIGISPEDLPHIFDRFFRSDAARNRSEGSGLGLSIARHITDLHRARIAVRSDVGGGTRFTITFPSTGL